MPARRPSEKLLRLKIEEALTVLREIGMPKGQLNERSALTLLALAGLFPLSAWSEAKDPLMGITPIMDFVRLHYRRDYAPNTRETFRRQTIHQFVEAGLAVSNPDRPDRPVNSPHWVYQLCPSFLTLVRAFGSGTWTISVSQFLSEQGSLLIRYAKEREMHHVPLTFPEKELHLTPGAHSELIRTIITEFGPRFAPGARVLYIGDTGAKLLYFNREVFASIGIQFDDHGKFPDIILHQPEKNWLYLIEAVTSHGPVDAKRYYELKTLFHQAGSLLVFVTAFPNRTTMAKYLPYIGWETEVWVADSPDHMIHFNGDRFLGPY